MKRQKNKTAERVKRERQVVAKKNETHVFSGDLYLFCKAIINNYDVKDTDLCPDYFFAMAVVAKEEKNFPLERQAILSLLFYTKMDSSELITRIVNNEHSFKFTEKTEFLSSIKEKTPNVHHYFKLIKGFILSGTKQQIPAYFNCFMGGAAINSEVSILPETTNLPNDVLLDFYEVTHRILIDDSSNEKVLRKLTSYIYGSTDNVYSRSLLFFLSYFNLRENDNYAIQFSNVFMDTVNQSLSLYNYTQTIAWNTANAAIRIGDIEEATYWLSEIKNEDELSKLELLINKKAEELRSRVQHPLNPDNIEPVNIDMVTTINLIVLLAYVYGCGDDWGLKEIYRAGRYIFPSDKLTNEMFKSLSLGGLLKMSPSDFNNLNNFDLNDFDEIIRKTKFHINISGVTDTKLIAQKILFEEIDRREDKAEALFYVWRQITIGYFYNSMEFYLGNVKDEWAKDFTLNEKTIERIELSNISAQVLYYLARTSIRYAAGQYSIGEAYGGKHIRNILIGSINRNLDWIENNEFLDNSYPRNKKQPVLASEIILEILCGITPEEIYETSPDVIICQSHEENND